jgi:hypothetical protein
VKAWLVLSLILFAYGAAVARYRGRSHWDAFGWPAFAPDPLGMIFAAIGFVSLVLWAVSALTLFFSGRAS